MQKGIYLIFSILMIFFLTSVELINQKKTLNDNEVTIITNNNQETTNSRIPKNKFIELTIEELKKLNIHYSNGTITIPMEMILNKSKINRQSLIKNGYDPDEDLYYRTRNKFSISGIKKSYVKYEGWDKKQASPIFPVAVSMNISSKNDKNELEVSLFSYNNESPYLINEESQKQILFLIDEFINKSQTSNKSNNNFNVINFLLPVKTAFKDKIKYRGRTIECDLEYIFWFVPSKELLNSLPTKYAQTIIREFELIDKFNSEEVIRNAILDTLNKEETYINMSEYNNSIFSNTTLYPNPAFSDFSIKFKLKEARTVSVSIYELTGQLLSKEQYSNFSSYLTAGEHIIPIKLNDVARGVYLIALTTSQDEQVILRLVVN